MDHIRYSAAAVQTDFVNPTNRGEMRKNTDRILQLIDSAIAGAAPFLPVKLVTFPEFSHSAPVFPTVKELLEKLAVEIPNEHTEKLTAKAHALQSAARSGPGWQSLAAPATPRLPF